MIKPLKTRRGTVAYLPALTPKAIKRFWTRIRVLGRVAETIATLVHRSAEIDALGEHIDSLR